MPLLIEAATESFLLKIVVHLITRKMYCLIQFRERLVSEHKLVTTKLRTLNPLSYMANVIKPQKIYFCCFLLSLPGSRFLAIENKMQFCENFS